MSKLPSGIPDHPRGGAHRASQMLGGVQRNRVTSSAVAALLLAVLIFAGWAAAPASLTPAASAATTFTVATTATPATLPYGGGEVTFTYSVTNTSGGNLYYEGGTATSCAPVRYQGGMSSGYVPAAWATKYRLAAGQTATFTCTTTVSQTTTSQGTFSFATGYYGGINVARWGEPLGLQSGSASATVTMTNDVSNVCAIGTIWGNIGAWGGTGTAYQYNLNADGTVTWSGKQITLTSATGSDIAISPDGSKMYVLDGKGNVTEFRVSDGTKLRTITTTFSDGATFNNGSTPNWNSANSLSFGPNGVLYIGGTRYSAGAGFPNGGSNKIYAMDVTNGANATATSLTARVVANGGTAAPYGYSGDFITLPNGDLLALAESRDYSTSAMPTKFVIFPKQSDGTFGTPKDVGAPRYSGSGIEMYGATYANGSLWLGSSSGNWMRVDEIPSYSNPSTTTYTAAMVTEAKVSSFWGATGSQEVNAQCTSSYLDLKKTAGTLSGPVGGVYTATYALQVVNTSTTRAGTYAPITDFPQFDSRFTPTGISWTGQASGSQTGPGPYKVTTTSTNIAAGATHTYTVSITFTFDGSGVPSACGTTAGSGLFNTVSLPDGSEASGSLANNTACDTPPTVPWVNIAKTAGAASGPDANGVYTQKYAVTVVNTGTATATFGALTDTPAFDPNLTVSGIAWTSTKTTYDAADNPTTTPGPFSGSQSGTGPFTIAPRARRSPPS